MTDLAESIVTTRPDNAMGSLVAGSITPAFTALLPGHTANGTQVRGGDEVIRTCKLYKVPIIPARS
jgi:hypothetical protein